MIGLGTDPFVLQHAGIVLSLAARYAPPTSSHYPDLVQSGLVAMLQARGSWKRSGGRSLSSWVWLQARRAIQEAWASEVTCGIRASRQSIQKHSLRSEPLDELHEEVDSGLDPFEALAAKEEQELRGRTQAELWSRLNGHFNRTERDILLKHYVEGQSVRALKAAYKKDVFRLILAAEALIRATPQPQPLCAPTAT